MEEIHEATVMYPFETDDTVTRLQSYPRGSFELPRRRPTNVAGPSVTMSWVSRPI